MAHDADFEDVCPDRFRPGRHLNRLVNDPRLVLHGRREHSSAERLQKHQARREPERFHGAWPRVNVAIEVRPGETHHKRARGAGIAKLAYRGMALEGVQAIRRSQSSPRYSMAIRAR